MPRPRSYTSDLSHFLDPDGHLVGGPAAKMASYLALIVEAGSVLEVGQGEAGAMPCSNPSRRKRCRGFVGVARSAADCIEWECFKCLENGTIRGWRHTLFDLGSSAPMERTDGTVEAAVFYEELWAMRRLTLGLIEPALRALLVRALAFRDGYVLFEADYDQLEGLADAAAEATGDARGLDRRFLDRFSARMDAFRTTLPLFTQPHPFDVDPGDDAADDGSFAPEVVALAEEFAAKSGRGVASSEDLLEAEAAYLEGRRPLLH
ncbi:MAG: hypothetical protein JRH11_01160 [Deltaproteobacteria bacterium]|nr:hypothetical protein [Deltaproteobacteria bacterium]